MGCIGTTKLLCHFIHFHIKTIDIELIKAWSKSRDKLVLIPARLRIIFTQWPFCADSTLKRYSAVASRIKVRNLTTYHGYDGWWWMVKISRDVMQYFNIEQQQPVVLATSWLMLAFLCVHCISLKERSEGVQLDWCKPDFSCLPLISAGS